MDRRGFLKAGAVTAVAAAAACGAESDTAARTAADQDAASDAPPSAPAVNRGIKEFSLVTTWPKNFPGLGDMPERVAQYVERISEGQMTIRVYGANEIVPAFQSFDAVIGGSADMYHAAEYYWQGKNPAFNFYAAVPFGFTAAEMNAWINYGGGQELWDELAGDFGIKPLLCGNTGHQMGGWFKAPVESLEDFNGLKMRIPGLGGEVIRRLGGAAVALAGAEIYPALQSGAIDATEWVGPWNDLAFGFHREASYYYGPGFHEPGTALGLGINRTVWDGLTPSEQALLEHACASVTHRSVGEFAYRNAQALDTLTTEHGVELRSFPEDVWAELGRVSEEVVAEIAADDPITRRVYDSYRDTRAKLASFGEISDRPYMGYRNATLSASAG